MKPGVNITFFIEVINGIVLPPNMVNVFSPGLIQTNIPVSVDLIPNPPQALINATGSPQVEEPAQGNWTVEFSFGFGIGTINTGFFGLVDLVTCSDSLTAR